MCLLAKDFLVLILYLVTYGFALVAYASAPLNYDLVIWLMEYAINIKRGLLATLVKGARALSYLMVL